MSGSSFKQKIVQHNHKQARMKLCYKYYNFAKNNNHVI